ncbi:hypothetical protein P7H60_04345 [Vagococcus carniphilus]|uniref:Uncharacterized protein n=1 Tax=Vagococcus carniphilus TaxID=218144 RepID=A0AAW8UAC5_9ENTE|nr:hypothetical protein [Vagococcus carniphilus]MDT2814974.1 hypothetical protein [Vagococcus carniphilus]MDT2829813.1 hypothetical protein [Vagococcus carniphilus]MDT2834227.1 hypothetical protein [Vagococcus carniphilus]MDT2839272.1 hypothetical protein [Vagococcus carniphilus]MDT2848380.1 hypothetical protein [Vagococcus carniphilus]
MENDYIMRQIKLAGEGIGMVLKKKVSSETLGEIQKENGEFVSRMDLILDYLAKGKFDESFALVNSLKYKMSVLDFQNVSYWFIKQLKHVQNNYSEKLTNERIDHYQVLLNDLL